MAPNTFAASTPMKTPTKANSSSSAASASRRAPGGASSDPAGAAAGEFKSRFEAYNRLQAAAVAFGEKLPIPEIVAIGGQSDGKSSLLEALLGFRFNVREVEMGTRRPLVLQMIHDPTALEPRCRFQDEDSEVYGSPIVLASAIADLIRSRTEAHLKKLQASVSAKPIVMRAEYAHCPNITIIDTPGFVLKAKKGEPENTPNEILSMVKSLASPPHRLLLFLQQSSVEWCSSLWLDAIREIDPTLKRTIIVISKFDNRLKEFTESWEVDSYLSANGYLGDNTHPFFVALPKDRGTVTNEEFRRQISQVDMDVLHHLCDNIKGGFNEEKFRPYIGFSRLKEFLEAELQKRYKEAAPATLALLEQRCSEVSVELAKMDSKLKATSDVSQLRRSAMLHAAAVCSHVGSLLDGAADPAPEQWGKTTEEEQLESGIGSWPGVTVNVKPSNYSLKLYGGAAFERVMHEFRCATYSIECPQVSREKVANILLAYGGRGRGGGLSEAAAEIARAAARAWLAPLLNTACERLSFVLKSLFDLAMERDHCHSEDYRIKNGDMDGYIGFHAALRRSYNNFIQDLSKQCKQLVRHHLDSVTSPYSQVCYENNFLGEGPGPNHPASFFLDLSDCKTDDVPATDQENIPPKDQHHTTPGKSTEQKEVLKESQMTVPETPSPDQPSDNYVIKKENGKLIDVGRKRQSRMSATISNRSQPMTFFLGAGNMCSKSGSSYAEICSLSAQHFAKIREVLIERSVPSALNAGFLTPCRERLLVAIALDLFAVNDEAFMDMFVAPGAVDVIQSERQSLHKRQKILQSCLNEFKTIARAL